MKKIFVLIAALVPVGIIGLVSCLGVSAQTTDTSSNATKQYNALWIPPILEGTTTATGTTYNLTLAKSSRQLLTGNATATYGYNGNDFGSQPS